ncbi:MAG: hypothetical protein KVP17_003075 [Porospora cf. gigantea B]|uniref:uncharacterized protein n=1 Tax=Porospora cf. gigantea B TaxID=2853592 RepID=UPI003571DA50|nr:MAG: hypothetical protein KVP17_003075 [Porospora cf. gigantea B]
MEDDMLRAKLESVRLTAEEKQTEPLPFISCIVERAVIEPLLAVVGRTDFIVSSDTSCDPNVRCQHCDTFRECATAVETDPSLPEVIDRGRVSPEIAAKLFEAVFSHECSPRDHARWFSHPFLFYDFPSWGLLQLHSGPCGLLAAVQVWLLRWLWFGCEEQCRLPSFHRGIAELATDEEWVTKLRLRPCIQVVRRALIEALVSILTQCKRSPHFVVCRVLPVVAPDETAYRDNFEVEYTNLPTEEDARRFYTQHSEQFLESPTALLSFLISVSLTTGITQMREDMDCFGDGYLIRTFGHCSQEMVNLLLTGRAVSNIFNDSRQFLAESGRQEENLTLHGIGRRTCVGLLADVETQLLAEVGSYFKCPFFPLWVLAKASHYSTFLGVDIRLNDDFGVLHARDWGLKAFDQFDSARSGMLGSDQVQLLINKLGLHAFDWGIVEDNLLLRSDFMNYCVRRHVKTHPNQLTSLPPEEWDILLYDGLDQRHPLSRYRLRHSACPDDRNVELRALVATRI